MFGGHLYLSDCIIVLYYNTTQHTKPLHNLIQRKTTQQHTIQLNTIQQHTTHNNTLTKHSLLLSHVSGESCHPEGPRHQQNRKYDRRNERQRWYGQMGGEGKQNKQNLSRLQYDVTWLGLVYAANEFFIFIIAILPDSNHRCYHSIFCFTSLLYLFNSTYDPNFHYRKTSIFRKLIVYGKGKPNWRKGSLRTSRLHLQDSR